MTLQIDKIAVIALLNIHNFEKCYKKNVSVLQSDLGFALVFLSFIFFQCMVNYSNIYIYIYIQKDATLHSLLYLESALHVSGRTITHH